MVNNFGELVLAVADTTYSVLIGHGWWTGDYQEAMTRLERHATWIPRSFAETTTQFRQIITQVCVRFGDKWLIHVRTTAGDEPRLHGKVSFAFGGHVSKESDRSNVEYAIDATCYRELGEELEYTITSGPPTFVAMMTQDDSEVSKMHVAVVYVMSMWTDEVQLKEPDMADLKWVTREEINSTYYDRMDNWSQTMFNRLTARSQ